MAPLGCEVVKVGGEGRRGEGWAGGKGSCQGSLANGNGNVNGNRKRLLGSPIRLAAVASCLAWLGGYFWATPSLTPTPAHAPQSAFVF